MDFRTIETVDIPASFYWRGIWHSARWSVTVADREKGDVLLTAYLTEAVHDGTEDVLIAALRLGMKDVARLREMAGFGSDGLGGSGGSDCYDCRTTDQRLTELADRLSRVDGNMLTRLDAIERRLRQINEQSMVLLSHDQRIELLEDAVKARAMRTELQGEKNYLNERLDLELESIQSVAKQVDALVQRLDVLEARPAFSMHQQQRMDAIEAKLRDTAQRLEKVTEAAQRAALALPGADGMREGYDAEHDAAPVSYWDMQLLGMIERLAVAVGVG